MVQQPIRFGDELRRRRLAAGLSLTDLTRVVHYSKGQLSKIERGVKAPSRELARLCDFALGAGGVLAALVPERASGVRNAEASGDEDVWLMQLSADGQSSFQPVGRRRVIIAGAASMAGMSLGRTDASSRGEGEQLLEASRSLFDQYRSLGQTGSPGLLLPVLIAQTHTLRELSTHAGPRTRQGLLRLGSRTPSTSAGWCRRRATSVPLFGGRSVPSIWRRQVVTTIWPRTAW